MNAPMAGDSMVFLATSWGNKHGGINSFSTSLLLALARVGIQSQLVCLCNAPTPENILTANELGIRLIDVEVIYTGLESGKTSEAEAAYSIFELMRDQLISIPKYWIGHDIVTGSLACACAEILESSRSVIIMHASYNDYAFLKHNEEGGAASVDKKIKRQAAIFNRADIAFAVGPLLFERLVAYRDSSMSTGMLIPGLKHGKTSINKRNYPKSLQAMMFGRLDGNEAFVKQAPLAVVSFAKAVSDGRRAGASWVSGAKLRLVGVDDKNKEYLTNLAKTAAGRAVNLEIHGFIDDPDKIAEWLRSSNLCLMPSWHEGFGLAAWEALAQGTPVIVSENTGFYSLMKQFGGEYTGCISVIDVKGEPGVGKDHNPEDVESLASLIQSICNDFERSIENARHLLKKCMFDRGCTWYAMTQTFCDVLGLNYHRTVIDQKSSIRESASPSKELGFDERIMSQSAFKKADAIQKEGYYSQALEMIKDINERVDSSYDDDHLLDLMNLESKVRLRLGDYRLAQVLAQRCSEEAQWRELHRIYVSSSLILCIIMLDKSEYQSAVALAEELCRYATSNCPESLISSKKTLARAYALSGQIGDAMKLAIDLESEATQPVDGNALSNALAKTYFTLGEIYRHAARFERAIENYQKAIDVTIRLPDVDCFIWSFIGATDSMVQLGDMAGASKRVALITRYLNQRSDQFRLEALYVELIELEIKILNGENESDDEISERIKSVVGSFSRMGITWPKNYFLDLLKNKSAAIKPF